MTANIALKDGSTTQDRRCDLIFSPEPVQDHKLFTADNRQPFDRYWPLAGLDWPLNQGAEGACVGFGITHGLASSPLNNKGLSSSFAREEIYWEAQRTDLWDGGAYPGAHPFYEGTQVRAGLRVARKLGYIENYRICRTLHDMAIGVSHDGPCILGTKWFNSMYQTDRKGYIAPSGKVVGGHCYIANGVKVGDYFNFINSWGSDYGNRGEMRMTYSSMQKMIDMGAEMYFVYGVTQERLGMLQKLLNLFMR